MGYMIIVGIFSVLGMIVSGRLKSKFKHYSQIPSTGNASGEEVAHQMLSHFGIRDVKVVQGKGSLTDHYNPMTKTISLSPDVFQGRSIASAAVSAHECGHAVQHAEAYAALKMRSAVVPVVNFSSQIQQYLFMGMMIGFGAGSGAIGNILTIVLTITFGVTALFSLITLPVEFDASKRALLWLDETGNTTGEAYDGAKDALTWAAMTYIVSALSALVMFLYFFLRMMGSD